MVFGVIFNDFFNDFHGFPMFSDDFPMDGWSKTSVAAMYGVSYSSVRFCELRVFIGPKAFLHRFFLE